MKAGALEFRHHTKLTEYVESATITQTLANTTDTVVLTHPIVNANAAAGNCALAVPNGVPGQMLTIIALHANDCVVTPATSTMFGTITLTVVGDKCVIYYVDDTVGWAIKSLKSVAANGSPAYAVA